MLLVPKVRYLSLESSYQTCSDHSVAQGGVSATSFIETYVNLSATSLTIVLATPNAAAPVFSVRTFQPPTT